MDGVELTEARWFSRDELADGGASRARSSRRAGVDRSGAGGGVVRGTAQLRRARTCASDGFVAADPSGNTTVGTVWLPPLSDSTSDAASACSSMLTSV